MKLSNSKLTFSIYSKLLYILTFLLVTKSSLISQQKLIAISEYKFNNAIGINEFTDSSHFVYSAGQGYLSSNVPEFIFDRNETFFNWKYIDKILPCDVEYKYNSKTSTSPYDTITSVLSLGKVIEKESSFTNKKTIYSYDSNGHVLALKEQIKYSFSPNWQNQFLTEYYYDNSGKQTAYIKYQDTFNLIEKDSLIYNSLSKLVLYTKQSSGFEYDIIYSGNGVRKIRFFQTSSGIQQWDINYTNNLSGNVSRLKGENLVTGDTVVVLYSYTPLGKITRIESYKNSVADRLIEFFYNSVGNLKSEKRTEYIPFVFTQRNFYYENISSVGLQSNELNDVSLFPNPTQDILNISCNEDFIGFNYKLYDNRGKIIFSGKIYNVSTQIDLTSIPKGIYYVKLTNGSINSMRTVIKI